MSSAPGVLYVVATPIGNLEDLTFRALRTLKEVDLIAAEDTRRTAKLLAHYEIRKSMVSLREHNEAREAPRLVRRLVGGASIALVSDAGTPAIADPGARLVRAARAAGIRVIPIPGASAVTAALSVSGLESGDFVFMGFPPATGAARRAWFERLSRDPRAVVFFEAPHRISRTLHEASEILANRPIYCYREITKINEELVNTHKIKEIGEFTVVIGPAGRQIGQVLPDEWDTLIGRIIETSAVSAEDLVSVVSAVRGITANASSRLIKKHKIMVKRQKLKAT